MIDNEPDDLANCVPHPWEWLVGELRRVFVDHGRLLLSGLPALLVCSAVGLFAFDLMRVPKVERLGQYVDQAAARRSAVSTILPYSAPND